MAENVTDSMQEMLRKKKLLFLGIMIILVIGGYAFYNNYVSKPEYIFSKMLDAYDKKDVSEFEKYVDVDNFSYILWSDYREWKEKDRGSLWWPVRKNIDSSDAVKVTIRNLASGKKSLKDLEKIDETSETTVSIASLLEKMHDYKFISTTDNGNEKKFRVSAKTYDEQEFVFDFTMEKKGENWKITKLNNVGEICTTFKNFARESIISYLKNSQGIQDDYDKRYEDLKKLAYIPFLKENIASEKKLVDDLREFPTNPFSEIINSNRILCSQYLCKFYDISLQIATIPEKKNNPKLMEEEKEAEKNTKIYNERVLSLIKEVGYEKTASAPTAESVGESASLTVEPENSSSVSSSAIESNESGSHWIKDNNTNVYIWNPEPSDGESITWSGGYVEDGDRRYANGSGTVTWYKNNQIIQVDEGGFLHGKHHGKFTHKFPSGNVIYSNWDHGKEIE